MASVVTSPSFATRDQIKALRAIIQEIDPHAKYLGWVATRQKVFQILGASGDGNGVNRRLLAFELQIPCTATHMVFKAAMLTLMLDHPLGPPSQAKYPLVPTDVDNLPRAIESWFANAVEDLSEHDHGRSCITLLIRFPGGFTTYMPDHAVLACNIEKKTTEGMSTITLVTQSFYSFTQDTAKSEGYWLKVIGVFQEYASAQEHIQLNRDGTTIQSFHIEDAEFSAIYAIHKALNPDCSDQPSIGTCVDKAIELARQTSLLKSQKNGSYLLDSLYEKLTW